MFVVIPVELLGSGSDIDDCTLREPVTSKSFVVACIEPVGKNIPNSPSIASLGIMLVPLNEPLSVNEPVNLVFNCLSFNH